MSVNSVDIVLEGGSTTLLSLATTSILATYSSTPALYCTAGEQTFFVTAVKNATIASVTIKCDISTDGTNYTPVQSTRQDTGTVAYEHLFALASGSNLIAVTCKDAMRAAAMKVSIKADVQGGTGESVTVTGRAW